MTATYHAGPPPCRRMPNDRATTLMDTHITYEGNGGTHVLAICDHRDAARIMRALQTLDRLEEAVKMNDDYNCLLNNT